MFTMVIGGSASGKSDYAERHVLSLKGDGPRLYIATMEPFGEEARARIARHHAMRRDRGFETIECYRNAGAVRLPENSSVLLEDLGNLVANELFGTEPAQAGERRDLPIDKDGKLSETDPAQADALTDWNADNICTVLLNRIAADIDSLRAQCSHLTIVTNLLAALNRKLAAGADLVVEVVCGLPDVLKGPENM